MTAPAQAVTLELGRVRIHAPAGVSWTWQEQPNGTYDVQLEVGTRPPPVQTADEGVEENLTNALYMLDLELEMQTLEGIRPPCAGTIAAVAQRIRAALAAYRKELIR